VNLRFEDLRFETDRSCFAASHISNFKFQIPIAKAIGGGMGIRTPDIQLAKLTLYQLSYTPLGLGIATKIQGQTKQRLIYALHDA
jgi:hypothetical protein